ncbi:hypothetical protein CEY11_17220 [Candidimonas nitroreducens]|uniref:DUF3293 domain-containing protein n=2 Tax=Candidimonas nitroreducens TaxID=683354 RepID=A0A225M8M3_9BURK|nr:hypothetical protein CEY11_17220 [Candidimonas nitroreducens]
MVALRLIDNSRLGADNDPVTDTSIPADTLRAYRETHYVVTGLEHGFTLRIDRPSAALGTLYQSRGVDSAAFVTACNPQGRLLDDAANARAQERLRGELDARALAYFAGEGRHPRGGWPAEASFLVLGLTQQEAATLGRRWQQNAVVCCGADTVARLVLLR